MSFVGFIYTSPKKEEKDYEGFSAKGCAMNYKSYKKLGTA